MFSSSQRIQKTQFKSLLRPIRSVHFKHIRVIYFNVAKVMDMVEVEVLEEFLEKKRRDGQVIPENESGKGFKKPESDKDKFHEIFYYDIGKLDETLAYQVIDWLAFKENVEHLSVVNEGEPRFDSR
jgi:hypothetical protein